MKPTRCIIQLLILFVTIVFTTAADADNWTQWRGTKLDSISSETSVPVEFSKTKGIRFHAALPGPAGSSPIVWEDRVFLTTVDGDTNGADMFLMCVGTDGNLH